MAKGHYTNMVSKLCSRCHKAPRRASHSYCVECSRAYNNEWAHRKRGTKPRPPKPALNPGEKFCNKCQRILPVTQFSRCKSKRDGYMSNCKDCDHLKQVAYQEKHRARVRSIAREASRRYRAAHPGYNAIACKKAKRRRIARKIAEAVQP